MSAISEDLVTAPSESRTAPAAGRIAHPVVAGFSDRWDAVRRDPQQYWMVIWGGFAVFCLPFLIPYFASLWHQDLYRYFPFLLLAVGYLASCRFDGVLRGPHSCVGCGALVVAVAALMLAAVLHSSWLGGVAFVVFAATFLSSLRGADGTSLGNLALPLVMMIRVPEQHAYSLVGRLQRITTELVSLLLDLVGIPHFSRGNVIELPSKELFVAEACSGIQSAFTMCFLALLVVIWRRRPWIVVPLYLMVALMLAVVANVVRVAAVAIGEAWYSVDLTSGWAHDAVGYAALLLAAGTLLSFDSLAALLVHPVGVPEGPLGANPLAVAWNRMLCVGAGDCAASGFEIEAAGDNAAAENAAAENAANQHADAHRASGDHVRTAFGIRGYLPLGTLAMAGVAALVMIGGTVWGRAVPRASFAKDALLLDPGDGFLTGRIGALAIGDRKVVRNGSDPQLGLHADIWQCKVAGEAGQVIISQPYDRWHELGNCYEAIGWDLVDRRLVPVGDAPPLALGKLKDNSGQLGYLFFTSLYFDGSMPAPPSHSTLGKLLGPIGPLVSGAEAPGSADTIMLQMWSVRKEPLSPREIQEIADSIATIRAKVSQELRKVAGNQVPGFRSRDRSEVQRTKRAQRRSANARRLGALILPEPFFP